MMNGVRVVSYGSLVLSITLASFALFCPFSARAQGRPDLVWMRCTEVAGKTVSGPAYSSAVSPDGKLLVTSDRYKTRVWRLSDGMVLRTFFDGGWVAFSPDAKFVIGAFDRVFRIYDIADGSVRLEAAGLSGIATCLALSPDGATAAIGLDSGTVELRSTATGALVGTKNLVGGILSVAYSPNGGRFMAASTNSLASGTVTVWDTATDTQLYTITQSDGYGHYAAAVTADSKYLITGYDRGGSHGTEFFVVVYDINTGQSVAGESLPNAFVGAAGSPDGKVAVTWGQEVRLYNGPNLANRIILPGQFGGGIALDFTPDASTLVTVCGSGDFASHGVALWRVSDGAFIKELITGLPMKEVKDVAISPDGSLVASAVQSGIVLGRRDDGAIVRTIPAYAWWVGFSPDNRLVASTYLTYDGDYIPHIGVWQVADGSQVLDIPASDFNTIFTAHPTFTPDGAFIIAFVAGPWPGHLAIYRVSDGSLVTQFGPNQQRFVLSRDGSTLVAIDTDTAYIYRMSDYSLVRSFPALGGLRFATCVAMSPDGTLIAVGGSTSANSLTGGISLFSTAAGSLVTFQPTEDGYVKSLAFSPDGQVLVAGPGETGGKMRLWTIPDGGPLTAYDYGQEVGSVSSIAYSPDGKFIYYGRDYYDGMVCCFLNPYRNAVFPSHGGNTGNVTVKIVTALDFPAMNGTTVTLRDGVNPDITIPTSRVSDYVLTGTFDLRGAPLGERDVVINAPGGQRTYPQGFTVAAGIAPSFAPYLVGPSKVRGGTTGRIAFGATNIGNIDAENATLWVEFPGILDWTSPTTPTTVDTTDAGNTRLTFDFSIAAPGDPGVILPFKYPILPHQVVCLADSIDTEDEIRLFLEQNGIHVGGNPYPATQVGRLNATTISSLLLLRKSYPGPITLTGGSEPTGHAQATNHRDHGHGYKYDIAAGATPGSFDAFMGAWADRNQPCKPFPTPFGTATFETPTCPGSSGYHWDFLVDDPDTGGTGGPGTSSDQECKEIITANDPNDLSGTTGYGASHWLSPAGPITYVASFLNEPTATAPAADVIVTDHLDATLLDTTTVQIGTINFAGQTLTPQIDNALPVGKRQYSADVDLRPTKNLIVRTTASLDMLTGDLTWHFVSLDPATMQPPTDPLAGFLDPGQEGSIFFSVLPKGTAPTGTVVNNQATIVFDANAPMDTNVWFNTIDADAPTSKVAPLAAGQSSTSFVVSWSGQDVGAGVRDYTIYVSDNGGDYTPWLTNTTDTSATFTGVAGHTYAFYSQARDNTYNLEAPHPTPDATTTVLFGSVSAVVLNRNRQPVVGAEVHLFDLASQSFITPSAVTGADGRATITSVPPGRYHIGAYKSGCNAWIFSPNFQGWNVQGGGDPGPIEIVLDKASSFTGGVQGFVRYDDATGAHPIGSGVHIDVYSGGHLVGSADSDANGHYSISGLPSINISGVSPWWGWYTYVATWNGHQASGVNFGVWAPLTIRMDIPFKL